MTIEQYIAKYGTHLTRIAMREAADVIEQYAASQNRNPLSSSPRSPLADTLREMADALQSVLEEAQ